MDDLIAQPLRLRIMAALHAKPTTEQIEFGRLKVVVGATDGNLGAHLTTLEKAGYVAIEKDFVGKKPRTRISLTAAGRTAFANHVASLRNILAGAGTEL
jgi:DNA-binding MarR family transcriptional regulator